MKLAKLLAITISCLFLLLPIHADDAREKKLEDLLRASSTALTQSTEQLQEAFTTITEQKGEISSFKTEITKLKNKISSLEIDIAEATDDATVFLKKIEDLENLLTKAETAIAIEDSNKILIIAQQRIVDDGIEIAGLRIDLKKALDLIEIPKLYTLGGGVSYPIGGQAIFSFNIPKVPISIYTNINLFIEPIKLAATIGVAVRF